MVIRWVGAFRKCNSCGLSESLYWELAQTEKKALSAERLAKGKSAIHAKVGLLVKNNAVIRKFRSDVWSEYRENGVLAKTRKEGEAFSSHTECFVRPDYAGVIIKGKVTEKTEAACRQISERFGIALLKLTRDGRVVPFSN